MSLVGRLSEMSLPEILQAVSITEKTGKLTVTTGLEEGVLVFRGGRVIYAASTATREAFGNVLVCLGLVGLEDLDAALERQHRSRRECRLGTILVEMGKIDQDAVEMVMQRQVRKVVADMFQWSEGYFSFRPMTIPDRGEVEVDCRDLLLEDGISPESLALDLVRRFEELQQEARTFRGSAHEHERADLTRDAQSAGATRREPAPADDEPSEATLGAILGEIDMPSLTAETVQRLLACVQRHAHRGILLRIGSDGAQGVVAFSASEDGATTASASDLWLPLDEPSIVSLAIKTGETVRGRPERTQRNAELVAELGSDWPDDAVAVPTGVRHATDLVLYADGGGDGSLGAIDEIGAAMRDAGLSMARARTASTPAAG